jgi:hypothetical protein
MLSVATKPMMFSVITLSVVTLNVVAPNIYLIFSEYLGVRSIQVPDTDMTTYYQCYKTFISYHSQRAK